MFLCFPSEALERTQGFNRPLGAHWTVPAHLSHFPSCHLTSLCQHTFQTPLKSPREPHVSALVWGLPPSEPRGPQAPLRFSNKPSMQTPDVAGQATVRAGLDIGSGPLQGRASKVRAGLLQVQAAFPAGRLARGRLGCTSISSIGLHVDDLINLLLS